MNLRKLTSKRFVSQKLSPSKRREAPAFAMEVVESVLRFGASKLRFADSWQMAVGIMKFPLKMIVQTVKLSTVPETWNFSLGLLQKTGSNSKLSNYRKICFPLLFLTTQLCGCKVVICSCMSCCWKLLGSKLLWKCSSDEVALHGSNLNSGGSWFFGTSKNNHQIQSALWMQSPKNPLKKLWTTSSTKSDSQKTVRSPHQVWKFLSPIQKTWMQMRNVAASVFMQTSASRRKFTLFAQL